MSAAQNYRQGIEEGRAAGEVDRAEGLGITHDVLAQASDWIKTAVSRQGRAYWLGWLRGYRDAVRTFERGRWGT